MKILLIILLFMVGYALSWAITTGIIYLICLCFGLEFSISIATGIWLILCLIWLFFKKKGGGADA